MVLAVLAVAAAGAFVAHRWTSEVARRDLEAARAEAEQERRERVPRAELAAERRTAAARAEALENQLSETRSALAAAQAATADAERQLAAARALATPAAGSTKAAVAKGDFSRRDDFRVYSADAELKVGDNITISSPVGMMLSDEDLSTIAGDLAVETPSGKVEAMHAFVDIVDGRIEMTADAMRFTNK